MDICEPASTSKAKDAKVMLNVEVNLRQGCCKNMKSIKNYCGKEIIYFVEDDVEFLKIID